MYPSNTSPADQGSPRRTLYAALTGVSLLLLGWTSSGLAAAHVDASGNQAVRDLQSLQVGSLTVEAVDLADVSESPEESDELTEALAPLLFLTPRVASILEDVFGDIENMKQAATGADQPAAETDKPDTATSPVADNVDSAPTAEPVSPLYENAAILPRFQRQMYRTDI
ncbi:MAG: hypothetical protein WD795_04255 [Woeseia sp.]